MNLFTITIIVAVAFLLIGVIAIVRGRPFAGILAILLAIAIAGFGYREDILGTSDDPTPPPTSEPTVDATPAP